VVGQLRSTAVTEVLVDEVVYWVVVALRRQIRSAPRAAWVALAAAAAALVT
jgi:hypothetical protein